MIGPAWSPAQWNAIVAGARDAIAPLRSVELEAMTLPQAADDARQTAAVEEALRDRTALICLFVRSPERSEKALRTALEGSAGVITMGFAPGSQKAFGHVDIRYAEGAALLGHELPRLLGSGSSYVLLHASGADALHRACFEFFATDALRYPDLRRLAERECPSEDQFPAALKSMVETFPNAPLAVALGLEIWGDARLIASLPDTLRIASLGASPEFWPWLDPGRAVALVGPLDGEIGTAAMQFAIECLTRVQPTVRTRRVRCELVMRSNLADFQRRYWLAVGAGALPTSASAPAGP